MITRHVNLNLVFDWLIDCFGPGYQGMPAWVATVRDQPFYF